MRSRLVVLCELAYFGKPSLFYFCTSLVRRNVHFMAPLCFFKFSASRFKLSVYRPFRQKRSRGAVRLSALCPLPCYCRPWLHLIPSLKLVDLGISTPPAILGSLASRTSLESSHRFFLSAFPLYKAPRVFHLVMVLCRHQTVDTCS